MTCPRCGKPMRERHNRRTGKPFLGCSGFPECRGTREIESDDPDNGEAAAWAAYGRLTGQTGFLTSPDDLPSYEDVFGETPGDR